MLTRGAAWRDSSESTGCVDSRQLADLSGPDERDPFRLVMWAVVAFSTVTRLAVAVLPEQQLLRLTVDDSLYYARVAQHLVEGHGSTFDGINSTNGYHPIWMLITAAFNAVFHGGTSQIRALVVVQALVMSASMLVFVRIFRPRLGAVAVAVGLVIWSLTPMSVIMSTAGLETSVATLAVILAIAAAFRYIDAQSFNNAALFGLASGFAFLTRTDSVFATGAIGVWMLIQAKPRGDGDEWPLRHVFSAGAIAAVTISPWLIWSFLRFGTLQQASSTARPMVVWDMMERSGETGPSASSHALSSALRTFRYLTRTWPFHLGWSATLLLAGAICAIWVVKYRSPSPAVKGPALLAGMLLVSGTLLAAIHGGVRLVPREYYFEWVRMSLGLCGAAVAAWAISGRPKAATAEVPDLEGQFRAGLSGSSFALSPRRAIIGTLVVLACIGTMGMADSLRDPPYRWQSHMVEAGRWLGENTGPDDVILSFNAGIISYYSQRTVTNLDGVINNSALDALRSRQLARYMCDSGAKWYADFEPRMLDEHEGFLGDDAARLNLDLVKVIDEPRDMLSEGYSALHIYRFSCS